MAGPARGDAPPQFTAVPWLRDEFVGLVSELLGPLSGDPAGFVEVVKRAATEVRNGRNPAREAGVVGMLATPEQQRRSLGSRG